MAETPKPEAYVRSEHFLGYATAISALLHEVFDAMALTDQQTRAMRDKLLRIYEMLPECTANVEFPGMVNHMALHELEGFFRVRLLDPDTGEEPRSSSQP